MWSAHSGIHELQNGLVVPLRSEIKDNGTPATEERTVLVNRKSATE